jgi:hypothetical protein
MRNGDVVRSNFLNSFIKSLFTRQPDKEFNKFMDFIKQQGVERNSRFDEFKFEKIADSWDALPKSVRNYQPEEPLNVEGRIAVDTGLHSVNKRLPAGYHISVENDGKVYVHHDKADPLNYKTVEHMATEVLPDVIFRGGNKDLKNLNLKNWDN